MRFQDFPLKKVADSLLSDAMTGNKRQVYFINAHCFNVSASDARYAAILQAAPHLYADGAGMAIAAKICGTVLENNVNGTDLFPVLCEKAAQQKIPIALLGAKPGIAAACASNMSARYSGLQVVWTHHGYTTAEEDLQLIDQLNKSGAKVLFVAKGVPMQEYWIDEYADRIEAPLILGVGALFDFYSGAIRRSPVWLRKLKLEWFFRLLMEPKRMFRRYVIGNPEFLMRAMWMRVSGKS